MTDTNTPSAADLDAVAAEQKAAEATSFQLSDEERTFLEARRNAAGAPGTKVPDAAQPICNCNAEGAAHYHLADGVKRA